MQGNLRVISILIICFLLLNGLSIFENTLAKESINATAEQYEKGFRYNIQGWIYVYIEGNPYERGFQHGYLLSEEIVDMISRWSNMIHNHPKIKKISGIISEDGYYKISKTFWNFCKKYSYKIYHDKYEDYPEYKQEIQGIADGVNKKGDKIFGKDVTYEDILTLNEMYEFLSKITNKNIRKSFHPLLTLFKNLKEEEPVIGDVGPTGFISDFYNYPVHHKCNGFIATGDATTDGQLVIGNSMWSSDVGSMWWWSYYITYRWSIILDINPTSGNRVIMSSAPGYIWSDHDYYQNDNGIVLLETTCPQGLYDNRGLPLAIRARRAIQYGNSIDDVMALLRYRNDGCMNAVWLIGDAKTSEIARYELGYRNSWADRTFNGFHWSANNPINTRVRIEKFNLKDYILNMIARFITNSPNWVFTTIRYNPCQRDIRFEELGDRYYGKINVDIVKEILSETTIAKWSPDCKITDTNLLKENGLWVFLGNPAGADRNIYNLNEKKLEIQAIPPCGWVKFYGLSEDNNNVLKTNYQALKYDADIFWMHDTGNNNNLFSSSAIVVDDVVYASTSTGEINALSLKNGKFLWNETIGKNSTAPLYVKDKLFIGTSNGLEIIDLKLITKGVKSFGKIVSTPVIFDSTVFFGNEDGDLYAMNSENGKIYWNISFSDAVYVSDPWDNLIFVNSGNSCYALDKSKGDIIWSFETDSAVTTSPYVYGKNVYFGSWDSFVYCISAEKGKLIWKYKTGWGIDTTPVISEGTLFVGGSDNNFYALDQNNGSLKWIFSCNAAIHTNPVAYGDYVFFGSDDGRFYAVDKKTGTSAWTFEPGYTIHQDIYNYFTTPILSDPIVKDGKVLIGSKGVIYALDTKTQEKISSEGAAKQISLTYEAQWFIFGSIVFVILLTSIYLILSKKRMK